MKKIITVIRWSAYTIIGVLLGELFVKGIESGIMTTNTDPRVFKCLAMAWPWGIGMWIERHFLSKKSFNILIAMIGFIIFFGLSYILLQSNPTLPSKIKILNGLTLKTQMILCSVVFSFAMLICCILCFLYAKLLRTLVGAIISVFVGSDSSERKAYSKNRGAGTGVTTYTDKNGYVVGHGTNMGSGITTYTDENGYVVGHGIDMGNGITTYTDEDGNVVGNRTNL